MFLGARGGYSFDLEITARAGAHHSGNWGGILSDPAIQLAHAISTITSPTGQIRIPEWKPKALPEAVREALTDCEIDGGEHAPEIDPGWGEPGLSRAEQVFGWCSFDVLAMRAGNPDAPVNAVPPSAWARCQLRFVVGIDVDDVLPALRRHLDRQGFPMVEITPARDEIFRATRLNPKDPWVDFAVRSIAETTGKKAGPAAQHRRIAAQRHLLRSLGPEDDLDSAFLPRLLAARAGRTLAESDRARRPRDDGRAILGPRRRHPATLIVAALAERGRRRAPGSPSFNQAEPTRSTTASTGERDQAARASLRARRQPPSARWEKPPSR